MIQQLLVTFPPMLFGAQALLTLLLIKGDICPGQRGRLHKMLPAIGVMWLAVASLRIEAFMVVFAIFYFYSQVQTKKTREKGPLWVLHLANGLAFAYVVIQIFEQPNWPAAAAMALMIFFLGASFSQLLLTIARSRLQAFHRILPVTGIISGMLLVIATLFSSYQLDEVALRAATQPILIALVMLVSSIVAWCWHIFTHKAPTKLQLTIAFLLALASMTSLQSLFTLTA
ncbi:hypothetical protein ACOMICROBIO_FLGHMIGD_01079 [Vibrio sp. B1FLJ16]|uniref:hypothetical protein n=1 Tax=Vibrio sp. B1FLJ16 TaxID=2751178 RepID=UPI0015F3BE38|nr:hypothetical protein [Vibrio sp. B1FLJ16]CAD7803338.1 hypothetical protein ACOMICROBIO_FLGHMIGD_01079 [Vibrio sp. B1FLJ16]CAE6894743.1 hypothetical protein ACOMICROBIO_FLGHMIGD_01079 [Vibrio sp. B1FLJ16]